MTGLISAIGAVPVGTYSVTIEVRDSEETVEASDTQTITIIVQNAEEINNSSSGGGGSQYVCKDEDALNYQSRGRSDPDLCKNPVVEEETEVVVALDEEPAETDPVVPNNNESSSNGAGNNNQSASNINSGTEGQADREVSEINEEIENDNQSASTSTLIAEIDTDTQPNQSANILGALSRGESCEEKGIAWPWIMGLSVLLIAGVVGRIFVNPNSWLFKALNNIGVLSVTALAVFAVWFVLNGCVSGWYVPTGIVGSWIAALLTRNNGA